MAEKAHVIEAECALLQLFGVVPVPRDEQVRAVVPTERVDEHVHALEPDGAQLNRKYGRSGRGPSIGPTGGGAVASARGTKCGRSLIGLVHPSFPMLPDDGLARREEEVDVVERPLQQPR